MGESQKDLLRACAREEIDVDLPFEELPKCDQDFVINGEKVAASEVDTRGRLRKRSLVRRARFLQWLESKTYKMHVRVLLSRYRAYTTCPELRGGRFQPETLNYRLVSRERHRLYPAGICRPSDLGSARFSRTAWSFRLTTRRRRCCATKFRLGSVIFAKSASAISRSIARPAPSAAAKCSESTSPPASAHRSSTLSSSWTSRASAFIRATSAGSFG